MTAPRRLVRTSQTFLATATVAALTLPALNVVQLEIVRPVAPLAPSEGKAAPKEPVTSMVSTAPVEPELKDVDLEADKVRIPDPRHDMLTRAISVDGYATVGVTWAGPTAYDEEDISLELRTLHEGAWTAWEEMHYDPAHTPEPGGEGAAAGARPGTDAVVVGAVDKVQVRVSTTVGEVPDGLELAVIDPGTDARMERQQPEHATAVAATGATENSGDDATQAAQLSAAVAKPTIFSRSQWGANEKMRDGSPRYGSIHAGFVHHTVNANGYSRDQVPSILRGIYAYHTQSRGWSDVGYNFLVDRFGRIWEGRYGGVARPVIGAHTLGYNEYSFAMSAIGNFETTGAPSAMVDAYAKLMAWKLSLHGVKADASRVKVGRSYFRAISGHRDAGQTACPGRYLYAKLPDIRTKAAKIQQGGTATPPPPPPPPPPPDPVDPATAPRTNLAGSAWPDIAVRRRSGRLAVTRTEGQMRFERSTRAASGWETRDVVATGDLTGDGFGDVLARAAGSDRSTLHPGDGRGGLGAALREFTKFSGVDQLVGAGDFDGNGTSDLVGRVRATGELRLYPGNGDGGFTRAVRLAAAWPYDLTVGAGDLDGDGLRDLVARRDGALFLVKGLGTKLGAVTELPGGWSQFDVITGGGDLTGDGRPDLLARVRSSKESYVYPGTGSGGFERRYGPFSAFRGMRWLAVGGQLASGGPVDVVGVRATNGAVKIFGNSGRRNLGTTVLTDVTLGALDSLVAVGDWNRDGHGDLMYRRSGAGRLMLLAGKGGDDYSSPVVAGRGFSGVTGLVAAGDVTGDGRADLLGVAAGGAVRVYPGDGSTGFRTSVAARNLRGAPAGTHRGVILRRKNGTVWLWRLPAKGGAMVSTRLASDGNGYDWFLGVGDLDGDGSPDVVARTATTKLLWQVPLSGDTLGARRYMGAELIGNGLAG